MPDRNRWSSAGLELDRESSSAQREDLTTQLDAIYEQAYATLRHITLGVEEFADAVAKAYEDALAKDMAWPAAVWAILEENTNERWALDYYKFVQKEPDVHQTLVSLLHRFAEVDEQLSSEHTQRAQTR